MASNSEGNANKKMKYDDRKCSICNIYLRKISGRKKEIQCETELEYAKVVSGREDIFINDVMCDPCRKQVVKKMSSSKIEISDDTAENVFSQKSNISESLSEISISSSSQTNTDSSYKVDEKEEPEFIELQMQRTIATHKYCFICGYNKRTNIMLVPFEARIQVFSKINLFIPNGNRCCSDHIIKKIFYEDELNKMKIFSTSSTLDVNELSKILSTISAKTDERLLNKVAEFVMPEKKLKVFTGLSWAQIIQLKLQLTSLKDSCARTVIQAIVVFLFKMRTGNSNQVISSIFDIESEQVSRFCHSVLSSFEKDVLPNYFGLKNADRNDLIENQTSQMTKKLYPGNQLILICDGTYIRHEKSSNNEYQRKSYSGQKKVPLNKPFTICSTNGYVVDQLGPYLANMNDAAILMKIFETMPVILQKLLRKGDIFVLDRGFRDIKKKLEDMGYIVLMPELKGSKSQFSAQESNETRFVTKIRWAVEAVHGIEKKKFRLLDHKLDNKMVKDTGLYCRIACYLNNLFGKRLDSDHDIQDEIFNTMQSRRNIENTLAELVAEKRWCRRKLPFQIITSTDLPDFPELTEKDLEILFTGSYQLKQTISYLAEMLDSDNNLKLGYSIEHKNILKFEVQSRHVNKKQYKCFVEYKPNGIGYSSILRYCCDCPNGNRTVGCCAHVAAIVYYLSHGRYLSKIIRPAEILSKMFLNDKIQVCINEDSDDDE